MDGGAWCAAVHGVARSWTRLSDFTFTFHFHALEKEMATHSSVLAWRIPGMGEPVGLASMGSHRVRHDWCDLAAAAAVSPDSPSQKRNNLPWLVDEYGPAVGCWVFVQCPEFWRKLGNLLPAVFLYMMVSCLCYPETAGDLFFGKSSSHDVSGILLPCHILHWPQGTHLISSASSVLRSCGAIEKSTLFISLQSTCYHF